MSDERKFDDELVEEVNREESSRGSRRSKGPRRSPRRNSSNYSHQKPYNQGFPPPPPGGFPQGYPPAYPQGYYYPPMPNPYDPRFKHQQKQKKYEAAQKQNLYAQCLNCMGWLPRNDMLSINVNIYGPTKGRAEKVMLRFCEKCHESWKNDILDCRWENDLYDEDSLPEDALMVGDPALEEMQDDFDNEE